MKKGNVAPGERKEKTGNKKGGKKIPEDLEAFLKELNIELDPARFDLREERVYYMPEDLPALKGVRFLRSGLLLGELKKKRFEPSQALAMYLKKENYKKTLDFSVDDDRVVKYLKGETLGCGRSCDAERKGLVSCLCGRLSAWLRKAGVPDIEKTNICRAGDGSRKEQRTKWQGVNRNENKTG